MGQHNNGSRTNAGGQGSGNNSAHDTRAKNTYGVDDKIRDGDVPPGTMGGYGIDTTETDDLSSDPDKGLELEGKTGDTGGVTGEETSDVGAEVPGGRRGGTTGGAGGGGAAGNA